MKLLSRIFACLCLTALCTAAANANIIHFAATLSGSNEVPPNGSTASGSIFVALDDVLDTLSVHEVFSGLTGGPASGAHIHCCAAPGSNGPVVVNFIGQGFPVGVTSGTYDHTFHLLTDLSPAISLSAFLTGLESGMAYANIHDAEFPGGEIRGQLVAVPEPASLLIFGLGIGLIGMLTRRQLARR